MNLQKLQKVLQNFEKYTIYSLIILYPIFVLPFFASPYTIPKEILLITLSVLVIISYLVRLLTSGSFAFKVGKFDLSVFLIAAVYALSAIFMTPNKMEAFFFPGPATFVIAGAVLYFLINQLDKKDKAGILYCLIISAVLLSISVLFGEIGLWTKIAQLPAFVKDPNFIAFGGILPAIIYMTVTFILSFALVFKENDYVKKLFIGVCAAVILLGIIILGKNALPGKSQAIALPDFQTSWAVGIETLKQSPFLGVGPGNYLTAFDLFRPVSYNSSPVWQVRFSTARDFYLTILTELGFAGIAVFAILFVAIYKMLKEEKFKFNFEKGTLIALVAVLFAFPASPDIIILLLILLAITSLSEEKPVELPAHSKAAGVLMSLPVVIGIIVLGYFGFKALSAEYKFQKALSALGKSDAQSTYNFMQAAVAANPSVDRYHSTMAQIDMALATSIANKSDVTPADKTTITQLVQQAISEAKAAVALNIQRSGNWEVLAGIYRSIMPFATGADQFAVQSYSQAVALDPTNPNLRISLGGVYYALGRYDEAIDAFKLAVLAKPDLANAHFNLSSAYSAKKDFDNAIVEMNTVLTLIDKNSQDYTTAKNALTELEKQKPAAAPAASATGNVPGQTPQLTAPAPVPVSNVKPPIDLPKEATPPATP